MFSYRSQHSHVDTFVHNLVSSALSGAKDGKRLFSYSTSFYTKKSKEFFDLVDSLNFIPFQDNMCGTQMYVLRGSADSNPNLDSGFLKVSCYDGSYAEIEFEIYADNKESIQPLIDFVNKYSYSPPQRVVRSIKVIVKDSMGNFSLHSINNAGNKTLRTNYSDSTISGYDFAIKELKSKNPSGRLCIFEGVPGTGKTHLIKGLLSEVINMEPILVPPDMVPSLAEPAFLTMLLRYKNKNPFVLVLEDADACLVKRDSENMRSIQAVLNLSDGIIGSMLDIRIVATTNATSIDFDPAITRDGRLSVKVSVDALNLEETKRCWENIFPSKKFDPSLFGEKNTLATIYKTARLNGWDPDKKQRVSSKKKGN